MKLLVVDDDPDLLALVAFSLTNAGYAVVLSTDPNRDDPRPSILTLDHQLRRVGAQDLDGPLEPVSRIRIPKHFTGRTPKERRDLASSARNALHEHRPPRGGGRGHTIQFDRGTSAAERRITEVRKALRGHPCHGCSDRENHARWAERWWALRRDTALLDEGEIADLDRLYRILHHPAADDRADHLAHRADREQQRVLRRPAPEVLEHVPLEGQLTPGVRHDRELDPLFTFELLPFVGTLAVGMNTDDIIADLSEALGKFCGDGTVIGPRVQLLTADDYGRDHHPHGPARVGLGPRRCGRSRRSAAG